MLTVPPSSSGVRARDADFDCRAVVVGGALPLLLVTKIDPNVSSAMA